AHDAQGNGFVHVTCPWEASHSVQDDRTGYNPHTKTFKCHHTSHDEKTANDVLRWLEHEYGPEEWARIVKETSPFTEIVPGIDVDADEDEPAEDVFDLIPLGKNASTKPLRARPRINSVLTRGEVTALAGQGGAGKGAVMLALSLSIAAGKPE